MEVPPENPHHRRCFLDGSSIIELQIGVFDVEVQQKIASLHLDAESTRLTLLIS